MAFLDRVIKGISPSWAANRARARAYLDAMTKARNLYEGATKGRRGDGWTTVSGDANAEIAPALMTLRDRARDLVRNNPYAERGIRGIAHNIVGAGIIPQFRRDGQTDARVNDMARRWFDTPACDADGLHDFYGLEALATRAMTEAGEVLIRRRWRRPGDGLDIPMQLQVLEPDFLDTLKTGALPNGNRAIQGVEFDKIGRRVAYWLFSEHPGGTLYPRRVESRRIPARDIIHLYRVDRPGQVRGVPWLAPVILRLRDFADYEDAQLLRQKIAACFAAFVHDAPDFGAPTGDVAGDNDDLVDAFEPGMIEHLPPGKSITLANPPGVTGYAEYTSVSLHAIAAGLGVTYELLTGDLKGVNFSSGRMGWLEFQRSVDVWRWHLMVPRVCRQVEAWFLEALALTPRFAGRSLDGVRAQWTAPRREMIDPTKEVPAKINEVRGGLITLSEAIRERGFDPDEHFTEYAEDMATLDELGLVLDSDARKKKDAQDLPSTEND